MLSVDRDARRLTCRRALGKLLSVLCLLIVRGLALAYAVVHSVRARFWPGLGCLAVAAYVVLALGSAPLDPGLPLGAFLFEHWWIVAVIFPPLSFVPMALLWRRVRSLPQHDPRYEPSEAAALAFLGSGLLDAALAVIVAFAIWQASSF